MEGALARTTTPNSTFEETCYELNLSQNTNVTFSLDESLLGRRAVGPQSRRRGTPADQDPDLSDGQICVVFFSKRCDAMVFHGFWLVFIVVQGIFIVIYVFFPFLSLQCDFFAKPSRPMFFAMFLRFIDHHMRFPMVNKTRSSNAMFAIYRSSLPKSKCSDGGNFCSRSNIQDPKWRSP